MVNIRLHFLKKAAVHKAHSGFFACINAVYALIKNTDFSFLPIHVKVYLQQIFGGQNGALHKELFAAILPFCPSPLLFFGKADRRRSVTNGVGGVVLPVRFFGGENFLPQL